MHILSTSKIQILLINSGDRNIHSNKFNKLVLLKEVRGQAVVWLKWWGPEFKLQYHQEKEKKEGQYPSQVCKYLSPVAHLIICLWP
jgi:hypothetical protein